MNFVEQPRNGTTRCPSCNGRCSVFGQNRTLEQCERCKGEGVVPLGSELPPAGINRYGQECCHKCGWVFFDDFSGQCDNCRSLSRRLCETGTEGIAA